MFDLYLRCMLHYFEFTQKVNSEMIAACRRKIPDREQNAACGMKITEIIPIGNATLPRSNIKLVKK